MGEVSDVVLPIAQEPIKDIWDATIGSWIKLCADKKRFERQLKFEDFQKKILVKYNRIPDDKKIEPKLAIVGPALEASKFYIDEEILRDMFAKLIANSMNLDKQQFINSAFVEIIKQMSPLDAQILKSFITQRQQPISRFIEYRRDQDKNLKRDEFFTLVDIVYTVSESDNVDNVNLIANSVSVNNLSRLGLIECTLSQLGERLAEDNVYETHQQIMEKVFKTQHPDVDIMKGFVKITPLGSAFIQCCMI